MDAPPAIPGPGYRTSAAGLGWRAPLHQFAMCFRVSSCRCKTSRAERVLGPSCSPMLPLSIGCLRSEDGVTRMVVYVPAGMRCLGR